MDNNELAVEYLQDKTKPFVMVVPDEKYSAVIITNGSQENLPFICELLLQAANDLKNNMYIKLDADKGFKNDSTTN